MRCFIFIPGRCAKILNGVDLRSEKRDSSIHSGPENRMPLRARSNTAQNSIIVLLCTTYDPQFAPSVGHCRQSTEQCHWTSLGLNSSVCSRRGRHIKGCGRELRSGNRRRSVGELFGYESKITSFQTVAQVSIDLIIFRYQSPSRITSH